MRKFLIRIVTLIVLCIGLTKIYACAYTIEKIVQQPTCGSNGLISFSLNPAPSSGAIYAVYKDGNFLVQINGSIANLNSLSPGSYKVVVTEISSSCKDSLTVVLDPAINALSSEYYIDSPRCDSSTNGKLGLIIKFARYPVTYQWRKDGTPFTNNDSIVKPAMKGKYAVTITDDANCRFEENNIEVHELKGKMTVVKTEIFPTSCDSPNGSIKVTISGRHQDPSNWEKKITYKWLNRPDRDTFDDIDSLFAGRYTLVVNDSLKCYPLEIRDLEVKQNPRPKAFIKGTDTVCPVDYGKSYGRLEVFITEGDSLNATYLWNQGQTTKVIESGDILDGNYICIVTDRAGCIDTPKWTIYPYKKKPIAIVPEYREVVKLTTQMLRIDTPSGLFNIVWSSTPEKKYDILSNKDSVIRSNSVTENTTYLVTANYGPKCETKADITIRVIDKEDIIKDEEIPNIFTPGLTNLSNRIYTLIDPLGTKFGGAPIFSSFEFKVYDRWGNLVFGDNKSNFKWDGTNLLGEPMTNGVYTFFMKYASIAKPFDFKIRTGTILLER